MKKETVTVETDAPLSIAQIQKVLVELYNRREPDIQIQFTANQK